MLMRTPPPPRWSRPKRQLPPGFIIPAQPILAAKVPAGDGWLHELKHDGFRIMTYKDGERVWLWSGAIPRRCARRIRSDAVTSSSSNSGRSSRYLVILGWAASIVGLALWTYGYFAGSAPSLVPWARLVPEWVSDWLPNLEAEIGMLLLIFGSVPLYWDMWRSR